MPSAASKIQSGASLRKGDTAKHSRSENMKSYADIAQRHAQDVQRPVPAFQNLYNSLSDEQRRTADRCFGAAP